MKNLIIKNLIQQYTYGIRGIQDLSLECEDNETVAILGEKEAGKTSLLKCIAGLVPQSGGEIIINGQVVNDKKPRERDVLMVYDDGGFFELRTVFYNLSYPLKIRKVQKEIITKKVTEVSRKLGFEYLLDYKINSVNFYDRLKVMIARALLREASVYLFDDPFKNAQPFYRQKIFSQLFPFIKEIKGAKVFATSSPDEAKTVGDKIVVMNYGFVTDEGDIKSISKSPNCLLSYKYMYGPFSNAIKAKIEKDEKGAYVNILGERVLIDERELINSIYIGKEVIACFTLEQSSKEIEIKKRFIQYLNNQKVLHGQANGKKVSMFIQDEKEKYFATVNKSSLRLFDVNNERKVYF